MIEEKNHVLSNKHLHLPNAWRAMFWKKNEKISTSHLKVPLLDCWPDQHEVQAQKEPANQRRQHWLFFTQRAHTVTWHQPVTHLTKYSSHFKGIRDNLSWDKYEWLRPKNMNFDWPPPPQTKFLYWSSCVNLYRSRTKGSHKSRHFSNAFRRAPRRWLQQSKESPDAGASCFQMAF